MKKLVLLALMGLSMHAFSQEVDLEVNGIENGLIYINEIYTGQKIPSTIKIPKDKRVRIGVGVEGGGYYQKTVENSNAADLNMNNLEPLPVRDFKVLILPIKTTNHGGEIAELLDVDLEMADYLAKRSSVEDILPGTYGMVQWDVTVFPMVENTVLYRSADSGVNVDHRRFIQEANLTYLRQEYDAIVFYYSILNKNGSRINNSPCCLWGWKGGMAIHNGKRRGYQNNPSAVSTGGWVHEWLHGIERMNPRAIPLNRLHSARLHGYEKNEFGYTNWRYWYYHFMTSQVPKVEDSDELPFVGVFDVLKNWKRNIWEDSEERTLSITDVSITKKESIKLYPNPTQDILYFILAEGTSNNKVSIMDVGGKTVLQQTVNNTGSLQVDYLNSGIYFLKVNTQKPIPFVKK